MANLMLRASSSGHISTRLRRHGCTKMTGATYATPMLSSLNLGLMCSAKAAFSANVWPSPIPILILGMAMVVPCSKRALFSVD